MATKKKLPPLAASTRVFLKGVQVPPTEHGPSQSVRVISFLAIVFLFAKKLMEGSEQITIEVGLGQIAEVLHCSNKTVTRLFDEAIGLGLVERVQHQGKQSTYTIYKVPQTRDNSCPYSKDAEDGEVGTTLPKVGTTQNRSRDNSEPNQGQQLSPSGINPLDFVSGLKPTGGAGAGSAFAGVMSATAESKPENETSVHKPGGDNHPNGSAANSRSDKKGEGKVRRKWKQPPSAEAIEVIKHMHRAQTGEELDDIMSQEYARLLDGTDGDVEERRRHIDYKPVQEWKQAIDAVIPRSEFWRRKMSPEQLATRRRSDGTYFYKGLFVEAARMKAKVEQVNCSEKPGVYTGKVDISKW